MGMEGEQIALQGFLNFSVSDATLHHFQSQPLRHRALPQCLSSARFLGPGVSVHRCLILDDCPTYPSRRPCTNWAFDARPRQYRVSVSEAYRLVA